MIQAVEYSEYLLLRRDHNGQRKGALLRFHFDNQNVGYADCHPWPELGDLHLEEQLELLRQKKIETNILRQAVAIASLDAEGRLKKSSLYEGLSLPESHYPFGSIDDLTPLSLEGLVAKGFDTIKVKAGRDTKHEIGILAALQGHRVLERVQFRFDFNEMLTSTLYKEFIKRVLDIGILIEFCEDPFPFDQRKWAKAEEECGVPLGVDRQLHRLDMSQPSPAIVVFKPAIDSFYLGDRDMVVTSYLDHPLGQAAAAVYAARIGKENRCKVKTCGLLSHHVYEPNPYSERLNSDGPDFLPPLGTGLGFDDLLNNEKWKLLR